MTITRSSSRKRKVETPEESKIKMERQRDCDTQRMRAYYLKNREKLLAAGKERNFKSKEERAQKRKNMTAEEREDERFAARIYYEQNREKIREYSRKYYAANKKNKTLTPEEKEKIRLYHLEWRRKNKNLYREYRGKWRSKITPKQKEKILTDARARYHKNKLKKKESLSMVSDQI